MAGEISADAGRTGGWQPLLIVLLSLLAIPRAVDEALLTQATPMLTPMRGHQFLSFFTIAIELCGLVLAGLAIDRFSTARVACVALTAWAMLTALAAGLLRAPLHLYVENVCALTVGVFFGLAATAIAKTRFPTARRARVLAILNVTATGCLLVGPIALHAVHWPPNPARAPNWTESQGALAIAGGTLILAGLLWSALRQGAGADLEAATGRINASIGEAFALLRRPGILALMLVMACHMLALSTLFRILYPYIVLERSFPRGGFLAMVILPLVVYAVAQIGFAFWSDARVRRAQEPGPARAPFIILGGIFAGAIGLIPLVPSAGLPLVYGLVAIGMAAFPLVFTLGLDVVPASCTGRYLGLATAVVLAFATLLLVLTSLVRPTNSMAWYFYLAGGTSLIAALVTFTNLRRLEPIEGGPGAERRLGEVFA